MRRKLTQAEEIEDDLPDLTDQQRAFVDGILNGKTAADAYRSAYDCSTMQKNSIWVAASRLRNHANIALWISQARQAELGHAKVTLDQHIRRLDRLQEIAVKSGNVGAAVQAEQLIGKASGHYTENVNIRIDEPASVLEEIRKLNPELADKLGQQLGAEYHGETLQ